MSSAPDHVNVDLETSLPITGSSDGFTLYKRIDKRNPSRNLPIRSRADWFKHAPPKSPIHIAQGRSAVELIDRWTPNGGSPTIPDELRALMDTHELTTSATISEGFAECTTGLYQPGSPRNHDLLLFGRQQLGSIVVGIEAKADEPLDLTLNGKLVSAAKRIQANDATGLPERIDWLLKCVLQCRLDIDAYRRRVTAGLMGPPAEWDFSEFFATADKAEPALARLRYQLFSGLAGTVIESLALEKAVAVFVIYEFRTAHTDDTKLESNAADVQAFCSKIPVLRDTSIEFGKLYGPFTLPIISGIPKPLPTVPVLIGKIRVDLREGNHTEAQAHQPAVAPIAAGGLVLTPTP